jgi:hypothetical protein
MHFLQASVVRLAASSVACEDMGVLALSTPRLKELLPQAAIMHGAMAELRETGSEGVVDALFAPHLVSCHMIPRPAPAVVHSLGHVSDSTSSLTCQPSVVHSRRRWPASEPAGGRTTSTAASTSS